MRKALALAERGRGGTSPNPLVGALIVSRDGVIVGRGAHLRAGEPHAEVHAIADAGPRARGATLYCTLEPCCHTGRTGPCTVAIEAAGLTRVVAAIEDPFPRVAGGGFRYLRSAGIDVRVGVLRDEARRQNEVFFTNVERQRPFVIVKAAMSLDGRIAARRGERTSLTGAEANRHAQRLRAEIDAIGVGSETLLVDDPLLTSRDVYRRRPLVRAIFDRRLRTPVHARVWTTLEAGPVWILTSAEALAQQAAHARALGDLGARLLPVADLGEALRGLYRHGVTSLLVEGGSVLHRAAWDADVVDRVQMYVTPDALGEDGVSWDMPPAFAWAALTNRRVLPLGRDCLMEGDVYRVD